MTTRDYFRLGAALVFLLILALAFLRPLADSAAELQPSVEPGPEHAASMRDFVQQASAAVHRPRQSDEELPAQ